MNSPKKPSPRSAKSAAVRKELITTGYRMITEYGIDNVGVRDISEAVGVTTGTFYYYFRSKDDLLWQYAGERKDLTLGFDALQSTGAYDRVLEYFTGPMAQILLSDGYENVINILNRKMTSPPLYEVVLRITSDGIQSGEFTNEKTPEELTDFILDSYRGAAYAWFRSDGAADLIRLIREHVGFGLEHFLA